jgi:hypothetical protein
VSGHEEKNRMEDLLAADQAHLRRVTDERINAGMFARVAEAHRQENRRPAISRWAAAGALAVAGLAVALWFGWPRNSTVPGVARVVPYEASDPAKAEVQKTPAAPDSVKRIRPAMLVHPAATAHPAAARAVTPRQSVFPGITAPTEQERLMMALAESDLTRKDPQLPEIAKTIAAQTEEEKGQRRAFEKWIQEGATR